MSLEQAAIAANRFGYGARPGELAKIAADPRNWVKSQITPEKALPAPLAALPPGEDDVLALARFLVQRRMQRPDKAQKLEEKAEREDLSPDELRRLSVEEDFRRTFRERGIRAIEARIRTALDTPRPVFERLVHFWSNHFTVSAAKPAAVAMPPSFEREAIRPHVAGSFTNMLLAATKHPGMLVYLDNQQSIGPNSQRAKRPRAMGQGNRPSGLNENLAREILELHTLGVNGGYTQADVLALAKIITGWRYRPPNLQAIANPALATRPASALFVFDQAAHEPGPKTLLGETYPEAGLAEGEQALPDLARKPATARFIAGKLARHYVADAPPPALVDRIARAYTISDGDLRQTMLALVDSPEAWSPAPAKFKRPEEYAISVFRLINSPQGQPGMLANAIGAMGQPPYYAPGPDGWADTADAWLNADLVWKRIEFAQTLAERVARADIDPIRVAEAALGPLLSAKTRESIMRAESPAQGMTLLLSSPDFQRR